jgi:hypothetical protein
MWLFALFSLCGVSLGILVGVLLGYSESPTVGAVLTGVLPLAGIAAPILGAKNGVGVRLVGSLWFLIFFAAATLAAGLVSVSVRATQPNMLSRLTAQLQAEGFDRKAATDQAIKIVTADKFDPQIVGTQGATIFFGTANGSGGVAVTELCANLAGSAFPADLALQLSQSKDEESKLFGTIIAAAPAGQQSDFLVKVKEQKCGSPR